MVRRIFTAVLALVGVALLPLPAVGQGEGGKGAGTAAAGPGGMPKPLDGEIRKSKQDYVRALRKDANDGPTKLEKPLLSRQLVKEGFAISAAQDPAGRYACFDLAREYAVDAGDQEAAWAATDALAGSFRIDVLALKFETYKSLAKNAVPDEPLIQTGVALVDQALAAECYHPLAEFGGLLKALADDTKRPALQSLVRTCNARVRAVRHENERYVWGLKVLEKKKNDGPASTAVGRYLCLVKEDWVAGLQMLAAGSDAKLKALAAREAVARGGGTGAADREPLAADWVHWAEGQPEAFRDPVARHAADLRAPEGGAPGVPVPGPALPPARKGFVQVLQGHTAPVNNVWFSPDGSRLVSESTEAGDNGTRLWEARNGKELKRWAPSAPLLFSSDGKRFVTAGDPGAKGGKRVVEVFDAVKGVSLRRFEGFGEPAHLAISGDGRRVANSPGGLDLFVGDVDGGQLVGRFKPTTPKTGYIGGVALSPDGKYLAGVTGWDPKEYHLYDVGTGKELWHVPSEAATRFLADGKRIFVYGWGHWSVKDLLTGDSERHGYRGGAEHYSADSTRRLCFDKEGDNKKIAVIDTFNDKTLGMFDGHKTNPQAGGLSRDGRLAISADETGVAVLWDTQSLLEIARLDAGRDAAATCIAFAPSGDVAALGGKDGAIRLWVLPPAPPAGQPGAGVPAAPAKVAIRPRADAARPPEPVAGATPAGAALSPLADQPALEDFDGAYWVWHAADPFPEAPAGKRYFRRRFDLPSGRKIVRATIALTADDQFLLYVNGVAAATSRGLKDEWVRPRLLDVTSFLVPGRNTLAVRGENTSRGAAGVLLRLAVQFAGHVPAPMAFPSDKSWKSTDQEIVGWEKPEFDDVAWPAVREVKPIGDARWGPGWRLILTFPLPPPSPPEPDGSFVLPGSLARLTGRELRIEPEGCIGSWRDADDLVDWRLDVKTAGRYEVELTYGLKSGCGGEAAVSAGDSRITCSPPGSGEWHDRRTIKIGTLTLAAGTQSVRVRAAGKFKEALMNLYSLKLTPVK